MKLQKTTCRTLSRTKIDGWTQVWFGPAALPLSAGNIRSMGRLGGETRFKNVGDSVFLLVVVPADVDGTVECEGMAEVVVIGMEVVETMVGMSLVVVVMLLNSARHWRYKVEAMSTGRRKIIRKLKDQVRKIAIVERRF